MKDKRSSLMVGRQQKTRPKLGRVFANMMRSLSTLLPTWS